MVDCVKQDSYIISAASPLIDSLIRVRHALAVIGSALPQLLVTVALVLGLSACGTTGPSKEELDAQGLVRQGQYTQAADEYLRLAQSADAPTRQRLELAAASALLDGNDLARARSVLDSTDVSAAPGYIELTKRMLLARVARLEDQPNRVLELLPTGTATSSEPALALQVGELRAWAYDSTGRFLQAANERLLIDPLFADSARQADNRQALWDSLMQADVLSLEEARTPPPDVFGGWVELATIAISVQGDPTALEEAIADWSERYPAHPASTTVVQGIIEVGKTTAGPPSHVALLLPLSGPYAKVAAAVRDGFLAAWFNDQPNLERPIVSIYNTGESDVWAVYETAIGAGADFVVGPLAKRSVGALASVNTLPVPTLALNFADPPASDAAQPDPTSNAATAPGAADPAGGPDENLPVLDNGSQAPDIDSETDTGEGLVKPVGKRPTRGLYQFALSPEGEARRVAERAWFDGHAQAALIWPEGDWGTRVSDSFVEAWENLGGLVVQTQAYTSDAKEMSVAVQTLLGVDQSKERWRALRKTINKKVEHQPRRRQDVEFIFMAGFPTQARQIRPQLEFHHASGLPVYSTSHVFTGVPNPAGDIDLNGVVFGDAPWILLYDTDRPGLRTSVDRLWGDSGSGVVRLYAFGADAYAIIPHLGRLRAQEFARFPAYTGRLSVGKDNRVQRELVWAQFANGVPRLIDIELPPE